MEHKDKIKWMESWCGKNKLILELNGEVGFGRECVGVLTHDNYPEYEWYDEDYNTISEPVWVPDDAYHKHPCVAVLGRGENAESQLYEWLKWFDDNGFVVEVKESGEEIVHPIMLLMGRDNTYRMVKSK